VVDVDVVADFVGDLSGERSRAGVTSMFFSLSGLRTGTVASPVTRDRCYDFKNSFAKKFCEKIGVF
jgi:hypothetical protein